MISVKSNIKATEVEKIIGKIQHVCKTDPNLSPRSKQELLSALKEKRLLIAVDKSSPVGWILRLPYSSASQELAAVYVTPSYRSQGIFTNLLKEAIKNAKVSILVTFNKQFMRYLIDKQNFKKASFFEILKISRGKFLFDRLNVERLIAIIKHFKKSQAVYLIHYE